MLIVWLGTALISTSQPKQLYYGTTNSQEAAKNPLKSGEQVPCYGYVQKEEGREICVHRVCYTDPKDPNAETTCYALDDE